MYCFTKYVGTISLFPPNLTTKMAPFGLLTFTFLKASYHPIPRFKMVFMNRERGDGNWKEISPCSPHLILKIRTYLQVNYFHKVSCVHTFIRKFVRFFNIAVLSCKLFVQLKRNNYSVNKRDLLKIIELYLLFCSQDLIKYSFS